MKSSFLRSPRFSFFIILVVSFVLRWALVNHGGQLFNPDEYRYLTSRVIAKDIQKGHYSDALTEATREASHLGFKIIGVIPALIERKFGENALTPSYFFSLFSWINIILVWFLALRVGADEKEALWAVIFTASSNALFYYSPHLFPYDLSLTFGLAALYTALQKRDSYWASFLTGFLGFIAFFTYNGYWTLAAFAVLVHLFHPFKISSRFFLRSVLTAIGLILPLSLIVFLFWRYGNNLWSSYSEFSKTITNGFFSEGAVLPIKYLWSTEYLILIIWIGLLSFSFIQLAKTSPDRIIIWLAGVLFIYGCLALFSVVFHKFVVYGRLARQLVPFLALSSAFSLKTIHEKYRLGHVISIILLLIVIVQTGFNFRRPFLLIYPRDFARKAQQQYPDFVPPKNMTFFYTANIIEVGPYKAYNIKFVFPLPEGKAPPEEEILLTAINPLSSYPPFRFDEGFTPSERDAFPIINMMVTRAIK